MENEKLMDVILTEQEVKILMALRDPVKGPKIREIMQSDEQE